MKRLERVDLAVYSRQMLRQAVWCGAVFALAVLFCILNVLPPVPVKYRVTGKVLVEPRRVEGLVQNLKRATSGTESTVLSDFQVLARSNSLSSAEQEAFKGSDHIFLKLSSLWNTRCSASDFTSWADSITRSERARIRNSGLSSSVLIARWELAASEHYRDQHDFLTGNSEVSGGESSRFQLAGADAHRTGGQLISSSQSLSPSPSSKSAERKLLEANVQLARQKLDALESASKAEMLEAAGTISLIDPPQVTPISDRIPGWMAASVLIILISVGIMVGWCQMRLQSGGIYDPEEVAAQLASRGVEVVAQLQLPSDQLDSADWLEVASRQASGAGRRTGRNLVWLSEGILTAWCLLILARMMIDPMWRMVLIDSPLAAFGRLVSGLP